MMLEPFGYKLDCVNDGQEVLDVWESANYDLILMDCQMPILDGYRSSQLIREREEQQKQHRTIIISLTANAMSGDRQKCLDAGMDDYISKPVDINNLNALIQKWLEQ